jgi:hypothetical protein
MQVDPEYYIDFMCRNLYNMTIQEAFKENICIRCKDKVENVDAVDYKTLALCSKCYNNYKTKENGLYDSVI